MKAVRLLIPLCCFLVACGGPAVTPTIDVAATQTRTRELAVLATAAAPTATATATPTPLPTNTPTPPLPTATRAPLPTATPAALKWHDVPIPPGAKEVRTTGVGIAYDVPGNELTVSAFMKREWEAVGLRFMYVSYSGTLQFYTYTYPNTVRFVSYSVERIDGSTSRLYVTDVS